MKWRDIETAPKDGTVILGFEPQEGYRDGGIYGIIEWQSDAWVDKDGFFYPTQWQPITPPQ